MNLQNDMDVLARGITRNDEGCVLFISVADRNRIRIVTLHIIGIPAIGNPMKITYRRCGDYYLPNIGILARKKGRWKIHIGFGLFFSKQLQGEVLLDIRLLQILIYLSDRLHKAFERFPAFLRAFEHACMFQNL